MLSPQDAIGLIYNVANQIYTQVQTAKANREQCKRLQERIQIMVTAIKPLENLKPEEKKTYQRGLNAFYETLLSAYELVRKFSNKKNWFVEVIKAGTYEGAFAQITKDLSLAIEQLSLGLNAQQIVDAKQDKLDQQKDHTSLLEQQDEILKYNKQMLEEVQHLKGNQQDGQAILVQQMISMKGKISDLLNRNNNENNNNAIKIKPPINSKYSVYFCDLLFDKKIGEGSFGKIYLGRWLEQEVAIKTIDGELTPAQQDEFIREVKIQSRLRSPRIVSLYAACLEPQRACLVMEYVENKSLCEVLKVKKLNPEQQKQIAHDLACGLYYLHTKKVIHRDLKSANVLIDKDFRAKLSDFGLAKMSAADIKTAAKRSQAYSWFAPEIYKEQPITVKADIYSFGVILWELFTGKTPFVGKTENEIMNLICNGKHEKITSDIPDEYAILIKQCWAADPQQRPDALTLARAIDDIVVRPPSPSAEEYYQQGITLEHELDKRLKIDPKIPSNERQEIYATAYSNYQRSREKGSTAASTGIGMFFLKGTGNITPINKPKALECFLESAEAGHARGMRNAALMLEKGDGVPRDSNKALYWYEKLLVAYKEKQVPKEDIQQIETKISNLRSQLPTSDYQVDSNFDFGKK